jgi:hypothetical protein
MSKNLGLVLRNYPTPGGNRVVNRAFMNFYEGKDARALSRVDKQVFKRFLSCLTNKLVLNAYLYIFDSP